MDTLDLGPSTTLLRDLVLATGDDQLASPTPCPAYTVADLCDHIGGLTVAFTAAAAKTPLADGNASGDGSRLEAGWRERIAADLRGLADAWGEPAAYEGSTMAGPVELPAPVAALVALNEVVVHAWDLAVATGHPYAGDPGAVSACVGFVSGFEVTEAGPFGPPVDAGTDPSPIDTLVALAGRDPGWEPRR
ncbi:TIGR03086 family metal-binding protein [soil metagenome]